MHTVVAEFNIVEGKEAEAEAAIKKVVAGVDANEPGCLSYTWHRGLKEPNHVLVFEIYKDDDAVAAHRGTPHGNEFQKNFGPDGCFDVTSVKIARYARLAALER